jgi:4-carboxymuconolactone decarboxylase
MMADTTRREQGRVMRRKLMGEAFAAKVDKAVYNDRIMEKFAEVTQETILACCGPVPAWI